MPDQEAPAPDPAPPPQPAAPELGRIAWGVVDTHAPPPASAPAPAARPAPVATFADPGDARAYARSRQLIDEANPDESMFANGAALGVGNRLGVAEEALSVGTGNLIDRALGRRSPYTMGQAWTQGLRATDEMERRYRATHPDVNVLGVDLGSPAEIAGSAALGPWGALDDILAGLGMRARPIIRRSLMAGGVSGLDTAVNSNEPGPQRATEAAESFGAGTLTGGIVNTAIGPIGKALPRAVRALGENVANFLDSIFDHFDSDHTRGVPTARQTAMGQRHGREVVARLAAQADPATGRPAGENLHDNPMEARGAPVTAAEALGSDARTALKVTARRAGDTHDATETQVRERTAGAPHRLTDLMSRLTGIEASEIGSQGHPPDFAAMLGRLRQTATAAYARAFGDRRPINDARLMVLLNRPAVQAALRRAITLMRNLGHDPRTYGLEPQTNSGQITVPASGLSLEGWDFVKRGLDDELESGRDPVTQRLPNDNNTRAITDIVTALRTALTDPATPHGEAYAEALAHGGEPIRLRRAFADANALMNNGVSERTFRERFQRMSASEQQAFRAGMIDDMQRRAASGRVRLRDMMARVYEAKLRAVFGEEIGGQTIQAIHDEQQLATWGRRMSPVSGSDTAENLEGMREQENQISQAFRTAARMRSNPGDLAAEVADKIVTAFTRRASIPVARETRNEIGRLLLMSPSECDAALAQHARERGVPLLSDPRALAIIRSFNRQMVIAFANRAAAGRPGRGPGGEDPQANDPDSAGAYQVEPMPPGP